MRNVLKPNLVVISDLHLGEGLRSDGASVSDPRTDDALVAFLEHYTTHRRDGRPWRLVINGDSIDFVSVHLMPSDAGLVQGLHPDDHHYGLGGRAHAAAAKLDHVLARHRAVFGALAAFIAHGNMVAMIRGNHDVELYWPAVQARLRSALRERWAADPRCGTPGLRTPDEVADQLEFHDWFVYEEDVAWIEHGHQYDPYCSFEHVLTPLETEDELEVNVDAALVRYVASRFMDGTRDSWGRGFWGHLAWAASLGASRGLAVVDGYRAMCTRLIRRAVSRWWDPERVRALRARHREGMRRLAMRARLTAHTLEELHGMRALPVVRSIPRIVRAVMLDRLAVLIASPWVLLLPLLLVPMVWWPTVIVVCGLLVIAAAWWAAEVREDSDPREAMRRASVKIRQAVRVPVVVFGHSHDPCAERQPGGWYFNSGTWVPHGVEGGLVRAFTHVVVERRGAVVRAALCRWTGRDSEELTPGDGAYTPIS